MKTLFTAILVCLAVTVARANLLFSDGLNYPNGVIETDGLWYCYSPASPYQDAFVTNALLILTAGNHDAVAAPTNGVVNPSGFPIQGGSTPSPMYASFTINVSQLPSVNGGFFCEFLDVTNNNAAHVFIDTKNTVVPGTYRLGIANYATSITAAGTTNYPVDLATGITYQVVMNWDENYSTVYGATLWINPSSVGDFNVYPNDPTNGYMTAMPVSTIGFSQYGGVQAIGNVKMGTAFSDVMTNVVQKPVIGIQPQGSTNYSGDNTTLYTAASGMDVTYQWYSNNVALVDNGVTVVGSTSQVLNLTNLQATATYYVIASTTAGGIQSSNAVVGVNSTLTPPFFTLQPQSQTNTLLSAVTLTAAANGTGPITYQWYFEQAGGNTFSKLSGQTSPSYSFTAGYNNSGEYYVTATGGAGSPQNSATVNVLVIPPPLISIATLKTYISDSDTSVNINGGQIFNIQGVVTTFGDILSSSTSEFFIQDGTGACLVYRGGFAASNSPPAGSLVNVISPAQSYYGELEIDPTSGAATNGVYVLTSGNPLPAPVLLNFQMEATNDSSAQGTYGFGVACALATMTNVYLYSSAAGAAVSGNFPTNSSKTLYAFQHPYSAGQSYIPVYVYTYTNALNQLNTNYWGKPIPSFCYELTGAQGVYAPTTPRFYPSRFADFVTTPTAPFPVSVNRSNGMTTLSWPAVAGLTYSVYSATNLLGPWTQIPGLGYYPSVGAYTDPNAGSVMFYRVSTP